ncbi:hypothetical protein GDO81_015738 [Engystomops pustulosus]|uniref:Uncharacterized protein n=1 Tax=Engystomops pustulosus TaxID=76066 RepID=A0AAV7ALZ7_ENGPU|nr:hypothetical protein GDO81_015738 [Engystomops pustulosus]
MEIIVFLGVMPHLMNTATVISAMLIPGSVRESSMTRTKEFLTKQMLSSLMTLRNAMEKSYIDGVFKRNEQKF